MNKNIMDSISLIIPIQDFSITKPELFQPNAGLILKGKNHGNKILQCFFNPTNKELMEGYLPSLTLSSAIRRSGRSIALKIQASLPKVLFAENVSEVCDNDFNAIVDKLQKDLLKLGIEIKKSSIIDAQVVSVHYGKNIILTNGIATDFLLQEIAKSKISFRFDSSQTLFRGDFKNESSAIRYHTSRSEICLYNKSKEYKAGLKSEKRSVEKQIAHQNLPNSFFNNHEIFRLEVRLNQSEKIRNTLRAIGYENTPLTFRSLFNSDIAQKINSTVWLQISNAYSLLHFNFDDDNAIFKQFLQKYKPLKAMQLFAIARLLRTTSARELRNLIGKNNPTLNNLFKIIQETPPNSRFMTDTFNHISNVIARNEAITINKLEG